MRLPRLSTRHLLPCVLTLLPLAGCEALFGGFSDDNPESCTQNAALCRAPDEVCSQATRLCEPALRIDAVSPVSAPVGSPVELTVTGRYFVPGVQVRVGGELQAAVTVDSGEQLRITLPAQADRKGSFPIEIVHPGGQSIRREHAILLYGPIELASGTRAGLSSVSQVLTTDLDGDRRVDLIVLGRTPASGLVLFSNGDGTFRDGTTLQFSSTPQITTMADVDRDGDQDLIATLSSLKTEIAMNMGGGVFAAGTTIPNMSSAYGIQAVDVTGDQLPDLLSLENTSLVVRRGNGNGTFQDKQGQPIVSSSFGLGSSLLPVDLDGDGRLDLIVGSGTESQVTVLRGDGDARFTAQDPLLTDTAVTQIDAEDLNFDGVRDLIVRHNSATGLLTVARGLGGFRFMIQEKLKLPAGSGTALVRDLNGDGALDLAACTKFGLDNNLLIFTNTAELHFVPGPTYSLAPGLAAGGALDWDGDGRIDLVLFGTSGMLQLVHNVSP